MEEVKSVLPGSNLDRSDEFADTFLAHYQP